MKQDRRRICYLISHGFAARMLLHSGLVPQILEKGFEIVVYSPNANDVSLTQYAQRDKVSFIKAEYNDQSLVHGQFAEWRRYFREPIRENAALWSRHLLNKHSRKRWIRWRANAMMATHKIAIKSRILRNVFSAIDRWVHRSKMVRQQLREIAPDLVVSTYPVSSFESSCLLEAKTLEIPTVGHLLSWDNITCKGRFVTDINSYISWGPVMSSEIKEHYNAKDNEIYSCGVPHFDAHLDLSDADFLASQLADIGLDVCKPYLFFGMSSPLFAPREIEVVEWLADQIDRDSFGPDLQLIVRPHPQNVCGKMADTSWLPRLRSIKSPRVALNFPLLSGGNLAWGMECDDLRILVNFLAGCSICLNSGSTLSIDALIHKKPVLLTFFDGVESFPWWKSVRRIQQFPHYEKLLSFGGVQPTYNFLELQSWITRYLKQPEIGQEGRSRAVYEECGVMDGQSASRVAYALSQLEKLKVGGSSEQGNSNCRDWEN